MKPFQLSVNCQIITPFIDGKYPKLGFELATSLPREYDCRFYKSTK